MVDIIFVTLVIQFTVHLFQNVATAASGEALSLNNLLPAKTAVLTNLNICEAVDIL